MRQYESIYVPVGEDDPADDFLFTDFKTSIVKKKNVIVLTVEELRELWKTAQQNRMNMESGDYVETCDSYLTSKGITVTDKQK